MAIVRFELELKEWIPNAIRDLAFNIVTFFTNLAAKLPIGVTLIDVVLIENIIYILLDIPDDQLQQNIQDFVFTPLIIFILAAAAVAALFVIGIIANKFYVTYLEHQERQTLYEQCQIALDKGIMTPEQYTRCFKVNKEESVVDKLILIGGSILLLGGGFMLYNSISKNKG